MRLFIFLAVVILALTGQVTRKVAYADGSGTAVASHSIGASIAANSAFAAAEDEEACVGDCLVCGHCSSCAHCRLTPAALAAGAPFERRAAASIALARNDVSADVFRASGPFRPPRA